MSETIFCDICHAPMKMIKRLPNAKGQGGKVYRRRKFACTICEYSIVIYAGGEGDLEYFPRKAVEEVEKMFKQEEENRETWQE